MREEPWVWDWYLVQQIPENTDGVVSGLILASVLLQNLECNLFPRFETTREKPWVWDWVVSFKTDIWELGRLDLDWYRSKAV